MPTRILLLLIALLGAAPVWAEDIVIGFIGIDDDPRYDEDRVFNEYLGQPLGDPIDGAETALGEAKFVGAALGVNFKLQTVQVDEAAEAQAAAEQMIADGVHYILLDLPGATIAELAAATRDRQVLLLNISAEDNALRQQQCQSHLLHVIPSLAMRMDALAQFLTSNKWREVLILQGTQPGDAELTAAFEASARRFGVKIEDKRDFVLSNDPRQRDQNNVPLLTGGDYDVVFVADTDGEFSRAVPYQTLRPQLVVGSAGLTAAAWHWAWERHGAPQLVNRFERQAERHMTGYDWAAWMGVKSVIEAVMRTDNGDFDTVREYLLGDEIILDGFKGNRSNFRPWDRQLRQPMLLVTDNWVVDRAPIAGFLHATNNMDTLGFDERDSQCRF